MNLITHLVKTDIRRSRGLLLVWLILLALQGMLASFGMNTNRGSQMFTSMVSQAMPQLEMLLFFVFVAFLVLADPLVGTTGFWLTRPISRSTLLKSKALFAVVVLVLPAVLVEVAGFATNRIALPNIALLVPESVMARLMTIVAVAIIAALTPTFGRFAIAAAAVIIGSMAGEMVINWIQMTSLSGYFDLREHDLSLIRSSSVATTLLIILGGGAVVAHQYLTRRTVRSTIAAMIVAIAALVAQHFWAWDFLGSTPPKIGIPPFVASEVKIELNGNIFTQEIMSPTGQGAPDKLIEGQIDAVGLSTSYPVQPKRIRPHLQLADGATLPVREDNRLPLMLQEHADAFEFALGGIPVVNAAAPTFSSSLFAVDADTYKNYGDQPLTISADIDCIATKYAITAEMPVVMGSRSDRDSVHLEIVGVLRQGEGVDIVLQDRIPNLVFDRANRFRTELDPGPGYRNVYLLRNKKRNEAVLQKRDSSSVGFYTPLGESRLVTRTTQLSFGPQPRDNRLTPILNNEWLANAELVRLDLVPVMEFSTRLVAEKLRLDGKNEMKASYAETEPKPMPPPKIALPENAGKEQVKDYIYEVLVTVQRRRTFRGDGPQVGMLTKVGAQNLDVLIEVRNSLGSGHTLEWNAGDALGDYLDAAIKQLVRFADKELIVRELPFDDKLAETVLERGLQADARETLMAGLSHRQNLPIPWIKAVASLQDPATYPDLKAYFIRSESRKTIFAIIRKLPGIDLADTVDKAWIQAKNNERQTTYMCGIAAEYGHADALDAAANILRNSTDEDYLSEAREVLEKFTLASGDNSALLAWYDSNREKLVFDPESKKFVVKP